MITSTIKADIDEIEELLAAIRGGVLVHVQDGVLPAHLKVPLDSARQLNRALSEVEHDGLRSAADALEAWLAMLAAEYDSISHTRTRSLLDQISEVEIALIDFKANANSGVLDVASFVDESFDILGLNKPWPAKTSPSQDLSEESFEIDSEVLEVFGEEAESLLETFRLSLEKLSRQPNDPESLWEIKKCSHTFKGASGIVGLKTLSQLAHRVEDLLERRSETDTDFTIENVNLLFDTADCLKLLSAGETSRWIDARVASLHQQFDRAIETVSKAGVSHRESTLSGPGSTSETLDSKLAAPPQPNNSIVRISLDRLDDLVRNVRGLVSSQEAFERRFNDFEKQLDETNNNALRLQAASRKVDGLKAGLGGGLSQPTPDSFRQSSYELAETARDATVIRAALHEVRVDLEGLYLDQCALISEIEARVMRLRNVEFASIANRLQRTVRVTCDEEGKNAEVLIENGTLEIDTQVIDALIVPLLHLLKNAVVHGLELPETRRMLGKPELGRITVRVSNKGESIVVSVTDDGRGIAFRPLLDKAVASNLISRTDAARMTADRIRELIFLPGLTTAEKLSLNAGRGVGMSIVRECVAAKGGVVLIETWPQKGTTFSIRIPRPFAETDPTTDLPVKTPSKTEDQKSTVLIVDDSPSVRLMTSRVIEQAGWCAETARDGIEALEKLQSMPPPAVILSDIEMPRMGGYELIAALRDDDSLKDIPVIFISSRTTDSRHASTAGVVDYLTKPYDENKLIEAIGRHAARPELVAD